MFEDGGYEALSMRKLAREIGIPPMSLYRYFPTKAHLIRHIWVDLLLRAHRCAVSAQQDQASVAGRLAAYLDAWIQYWLDHRRHYWVVFAINGLGGCDRDSGAGREELRPDPWRVLAILSELVNGCAEEANDVPPCPHIAEALFCKTLGFLTGVIGMATLADADIDGLKRCLVAEMVEQIVSGRAGTLPVESGGVRA